MLKLCTVLIGVQSALVRRADHRSELKRQEEKKAAPVVQTASTPDGSEENAEQESLHVGPGNDIDLLAKQIKHFSTENENQYFLSLLLAQQKINTFSLSNKAINQSELLDFFTALEQLDGLEENAEQESLHVGPGNDNDLLAKMIKQKSQSLEQPVDDLNLIFGSKFLTEISAQMPLQLEEDDDEFDPALEAMMEVADFTSRSLQTEVVDDSEMDELAALDSTSRTRVGGGDRVRSRLTGELEDGDPDSDTVSERKRRKRSDAGTSGERKYSMGKRTPVAPKKLPFDKEVDGSDSSTASQREDVEEAEVHIKSWIFRFS